MAKATKKQARDVYGKFFYTLHHLNGGTVDENLVQAKACYESLQIHAKEAAEIVANPNKRLSEDEWLMEALQVNIPFRMEAFRFRYGF